MDCELGLGPVLRNGGVVGRSSEMMSVLITASTDYNNMQRRNTRSNLFLSSGKTSR
jgi:hypothetical protein